MSSSPADAIRVMTTARRQRLAALLGDRPALLPAGAASPRNYAGNPFPFRAASHFLYFAGLPLEHAFLLLEGDTSTLFVPEPTDADALWHGETPSFAELAEATGCAVEPLSRVRAPKHARTLATVDLGTCAHQSEILGRTIRPGVVSDLDRALAEAVIAIRLRHDGCASTAIAMAHTAWVSVLNAGTWPAPARSARSILPDKAWAWAPSDS